MKPPSPALLAGKLQTVATLAGAGIIRPQRPDRLLSAAVALIRWGATPAAGYKAAASRYPDVLGLIDESGTLTFKELHERSNALAHALADEGVKAGDARRRSCAATTAAGSTPTSPTNKLGANALFMNTAFSGPQLADVAEREDPVAIIFDEEFTDVLEAASEGRRRYIAWHEPEGERADKTLDELIEGGDTSDLAPPPEQGKAVILTSGTTGTPKGASRKQPQSLDPVAALLERIPLRSRGRAMIAAPLFHAWGFAHFTLAMGLATTVVLAAQVRPRGDALADRAARVHVADRRAGDAPAHPRARRRGARAATTSPSSRAVAGLAARRCPARCPSAGWTLFGDNLYNLYGSTEVAWATIATPADLRAAPGTAGRPPRGTIVRLFDDDGSEVARGRDRAHLRRQRPRVRGLHRRRQQGRDRRAALVRRRRALRRGRAACSSTAATTT